MTDEQPSPDPQVCTKPVSDHTGFHFHQCGKPAKYAVTKVSGVTIYRCGIHVKAYQKYMKYGHSVESVEFIA